MGVTAAYNTSYLQRTPYITLTEYLNGIQALDLTALIPGGSTTEQNTAATEAIARASSDIDTYTCGAMGTLCATSNTETGRVRANQGCWRIHPKYWPILEVDSFSVGSTPATLYAIPLSTSNLFIEEQTFSVYGSGGLSSSAGPLEFGVGRFGQESLAEWTYVNGWVNTTLAASVGAGSASITPVSLAGIYPGSIFTLYDVPNGDESVQVASGYVPGTTPVPLVSSLAYSHAAGISVSALPPVVKQAAILITSALIKTRGDSSWVIGEHGGEPSFSEHGSPDMSEDLALAYEMLDPFRVVVV